MDTEPFPVIINHIQASIYVSAAGVVVLLYDHILTFDQEMQLIWHGKMTASKLLFLFNRYLAPIVMLIRTHDFNDISVPVFSVTWSIGISAVVGVITMGVNDLLVLLRVWELWDQNRCLMYWVGPAVFLAQVASFVIAGFVISSSLPFIVYSPEFHSCLVWEKPKFGVGNMFIPGLATEVVLFFLVWWNFLDRPRSHDTNISYALYRDGFFYFSALFVLRLANIILGIVAPVFLEFLGLLSLWCAANVTLSRLILNSRGFTYDSGKSDSNIALWKTPQEASMENILQIGYELEPMAQN